MQSTTARPRSLDEISNVLRDWWAQHRRQSKVRFSRPSGSENLLVMRCRREPKVRVSFDKNALSCELSGKKLYVLLDDFDVETSVDETHVSCEFTLRQFSNRALSESLKAVNNSRHSVFVTRAINAVRDLEHELPSERIEEASAASTDYLMLLAALSSPSVATQMASKDPLAAARLRGAARQQSLLKANGGVLSGEEAAELLGISRQAVDKRRRNGQLIGLTQGRRGYAYPAWQFDAGRTVSNLDTVLDALKDHDSWMQFAFFVNPNDLLRGKTPLEQLRSGEIEAVLQAAASYGVQGAA